MMGSFLTRGLVMVFGYAYPAYECFKTVEKNKPEIEQLRFWCQYWILVALLTVFERVGDTFVSWVPMYSEAKLAFFIYLWYPKTKGTTYVYDSFFRPYVAKHEPDIDRNLLELKTRAGDMAVLYCQRAATYGQTRIFEILQYVAAQSTPTPRPSQQGTGARVAIVRPEQEDITVVAAPPPQPQQQQQQQQPPPPQSRTSSSTAGPTQKQQASLARSSSATSSTQQQQHQPPSRASSTPRQQQETSVSEVEPSTSVQPPATITDTKADAAVVAASSTSPTPQEDVLMEEVIRVTRGRLRKNRAVAATKT